LRFSAEGWKEGGWAPRPSLPMGSRGEDRFPSFLCYRLCCAGFRNIWSWGLWC